MTEVLPNLPENKEYVPQACPYHEEKVRQIFAQFLKDEILEDDEPNEFSPHPINPEKIKTHWIPEATEKLEINPPEGTEALVWPSICSEQVGSAWADFPNLSENIKQSLKTLYLGHDGLIWGIRCEDHWENAEEKEKIREQFWEDLTDCRRVLKSLPNLKNVWYCGYYSQIDYSIIEEEFPYIEFKPIC